jgi:hypothetical protein
VYVKSVGVGADTISCLFLSRVQMVHSKNVVSDPL